MGNKEVDDDVLLAENEDDTQWLLRQFNITAKEFNIIVYHRKIAAKTFFQFPFRYKLVVYNNIIGKCQN